MGWGNPIALMLGAFALILVLAGIEDARHREIANWKNGAIALLAPFWWWANGLALWPDMAIQLGLALGVFGFFCVAFNFGWMGGGDVKMIGALALWFPLVPLVGMLMIMSLLGGVLTLIMMIEKYFRKNKNVLEIPYGVAIAIAALISIREPIFNQFL
ncbi:peptidase [Sphingomonas sp. So64.6b]|uniref:A24 family peptidase n=1 Tax=Sphingomonas sp. So64.6b TaxID=2997354 RepID=UPI0015FF8FF0|nr:prepilin peptidase [Sphingomonas sp. So64.6b]QNA84764.1 peptidase [Sphingomonas sp. So64.6b]